MLQVINRPYGGKQVSSARTEPSQNSTESGEREKKERKEASNVYEDIRRRCDH